MQLTIGVKVERVAMESSTAVASLYRQLEKEGFDEVVNKIVLTDKFSVVVVVLGEIFKVNNNFYPNL